jgi:putative MATE family efflux protein
MVLDLKYKTILSVALPLMTSSFIQSIVLITDSSFLSRFDTQAFDAVGNAGLIYITVYMALVGLSDAAQIVIARRIGQNQTDAVKNLFHSSLLTHFLVASLLFCFTYFLMPGLVKVYSKHQDIAIMQGDFISIRSFSLFFAMISLSIQALFLAHGKTWVVLLAAMITASSNVLFGYALIFGNFGLPKMGIEGAALASTLADAFGMLTLLGFLFFSDENKKYLLLKRAKIQWEIIKELFQIGYPLMIQGIIALGTWTLFFTWIEQMGKFELTVSQNIRSIYFIAFVPIWGFAATTKTYISQYLGAKDFEGIKKVQRRIQFLTVLFLFILFHGAIFYPEQLIKIVNPDELYLQKTVAILRLIAGSILIFGLSSVYFQTVNGSGNTKSSLAIEFGSVSIYMLATFLFIKVLHFNIYWVWTVEYIYFISLGLFSILYLRFSDWKDKVI